MQTQNQTSKTHSKLHLSQAVNLSRPKPKKQALGKDANISAKTKSKAKIRHAAILSRTAKFRLYRLLSYAQYLLIKFNVRGKNRNKNRIEGENFMKPHRTRFCNAVRRHGADNIRLKISKDENESNASLSGLQTCGSVWACPVCAARIAVQRGKEIKQALGYFRENDLMPIMLTLTASHSLRDRLGDFKRRFKKSWQSFDKSGSWRRLLTKLDIEHSIKAVEVTRTYENGWHYHYHILYAIDKAKLMSLSDEEINDFREQIAKLWLAALNKQGLHANKKHGVDLSYHGNVGEKYLSKLGLQEDEQSNLEYELSAGRNKDYKGRNIWAILESASSGNEEDESLYIEYVEAMTGENWITWSHGLKALVGLDDVSDEEASEEDAEAYEMETLYIFQDAQFAPVRYFRAQAELLELAATSRSLEVISDYLAVLDADYKASLDRVSRINELKTRYESINGSFQMWRNYFNKKNEHPPQNHDFWAIRDEWRYLRAELSDLGAFDE